MKQYKASRIFKIRDKIAEIRIRMQRGQGFFYELKSALIISAGIKIIVNITTLVAMILTLIVLIGFYIIGWIDLKYIKMYQRENELLTSKYNPHLNKISKLAKTKTFK